MNILFISVFLLDFSKISADAPGINQLSGNLVLETTQILGSNFYVSSNVTQGCLLFLLVLHWIIKKVNMESSKLQVDGLHETLGRSSEKYVSFPYV